MWKTKTMKRVYLNVILNSCFTHETKTKKYTHTHTVCHMSFRTRRRFDSCWVWSLSAGFYSIRVVPQPVCVPTCTKHVQLQHACLQMLQELWVASWLCEGGMLWSREIRSSSEGFERIFSFPFLSFWLSTGSSGANMRAHAHTYTDVRCWPCTWLAVWESFGTQVSAGGHPKLFIT